MLGESLEADRQKATASAGGETQLRAVGSLFLVTVRQGSKMQSLPE